MRSQPLRGSILGHLSIHWCLFTELMAIWLFFRASSNSPYKKTLTVAVYDAVLCRSSCEFSYTGMVWTRRADQLITRKLRFLSAVILWDLIVWLCIVRANLWTLNLDIDFSISQVFVSRLFEQVRTKFNPLNPELNPICYLLALLGAHHSLHVSRIRVKSLTFRLLMSYIYAAPILDVSRSHTTTQHSR